MKVEIEVPSREQVLSCGCPVPVARKGVPWSQRSLGAHRKERGVYVICHAGQIEYVGKTDAPSMSFGKRLRREFSETASHGGHIYPKLEALPTPPDILVSLFPTGEVRKLVQASEVALNDRQRVAILETVLIQVYGPNFQKENEMLQVAKPLAKTLGLSVDHAFRVVKHCSDQQAANPMREAASSSNTRRVER